MPASIRFSPIYFILAILMFAFEVIIAAFFHDGFVRPYLGDFLVVLFLYCLLRAFINMSYWAAAISVLLFSYLVETSQYYHLIYKLRLENSLPARLILGTSFEWSDLVAYTSGILLVVLIEIFLDRNRQSTIQGVELQ